MRKSILLTFSLIALVSVIVSACSKYEEGPKFTLASKKSRLKGDWKLIGRTINDESEDISDLSYFIYIEKDGSYSTDWTVDSFYIHDTGHWKFSDDKTGLILTDADGDQYLYRILKLTKDELKLKDEQSSTEIVSSYLKYN